uniref:Uncharacterized protein n=1 Tax=Meloidogyne enterolobii TaxID=390850 RepID=A0A6V7U0M0_MELEN|nr:unnamed protein product [Meloidogyne enterolobii]
MLLKKEYIKVKGKKKKRRMRDCWPRLAMSKQTEKRERIYKHFSKRLNHKKEEEKKNEQAAKSPPPKHF